MRAVFRVAHRGRGNLRALGLPELPGWIGEHEVESPCGHAGLGRIAGDLRERQLGDAHRLRDRGRVGGELRADALINARRAQGAAAERLESVGAGAGEEVEHRRARDERREWVQVLTWPTSQGVSEEWQLVP